MRHAFYFHVIFWRRFECVLAYTMACDGLLSASSFPDKSTTTTASAEGWKARSYWAGFEPRTSVGVARNSHRLLRLGYHTLQWSTSSEARRRMDFVQPVFPQLPTFPLGLLCSPLSRARVTHSVVLKHGPTHPDQHRDDI